MSIWDYIIVGAGSAGCVLANRLSADPSVSVLLVEAGGSDRNPVIKIPAATDLWGIGNPRWDWCFRTEPDPSREGRVDLWPRGKCLGGSSSINGMVYMRGLAGDYDRWRDAGNAGWGFADLLPYFRRSEANVHGASPYHGADGEMAVSEIRSPHPLTNRFVEAAVAAGIAHTPDLTGVAEPGVGLVQVTQQRGRRVSAADAFLRPALRRPNLAVLTRSHVHRVLLDGRRAVGIAYRRHGQAVGEARARREVILSAGAIGSPHLLMLSGIGPAAHLREHGIAPAIDSPGVGANLQDHVGAYLTYRVSQPTYNCEKGLVRTAYHGANWLLFGRGPATTPGGQAAAHVRSRPGLSEPDIQIQFTPVGYRLTPEELVVLDEPVVTAIPNVSRPRSRGSIRLCSAEPTIAPAIHCRLLADPLDTEALTAGCRATRRIFRERPLADCVVSELDPGTDVQTDDDWRAYLAAAAITNYHPVGTCRMGTDREAVVDPQLRVRDVDALRIVDASIMPSLVSGNINATCVAIGEKGADLIRDRAPATGSAGRAAAVSRGIGSPEMCAKKRMIS